MDTLEIDSVEISFNNKSILNAIYIKAESGTVTGILGNNGCGKSTLLRIIFGELKPIFKSLRINGKRFLFKNECWQSVPLCGTVLMADCLAMITNSCNDCDGTVCTSSGFAMAF